MKYLMVGFFALLFLGCNISEGRVVEKRIVVSKCELTTETGLSKIILVSCPEKRFEFILSDNERRRICVVSESTYSSVSLGDVFKCQYKLDEK